MPEQITESVIIHGDANKIFEMWSNLDLLPKIIPEIKELKQINENKSHWVIKGPLGKDFEWTAEITRFDADRRIAWRTLEGDIKTSGQVTFQDLPQNQTELTVMLQYVPPAGKVGGVLAKIFADPREKITEGLRDFKAYVERMPDRIEKNNKE